MPLQEDSSGAHCITRVKSTPQNRQASTNYHLFATTVTTDNHQHSSTVPVSFQLAIRLSDRRDLLESFAVHCVPRRGRHQSFQQPQPMVPDGSSECGTCDVTVPLDDYQLVRNHTTVLVSVLEQMD